ncbi:MAG: phosphoribosylformylglycinamidine synthase subunit PurS [Cyanobacteria bacterium MAG APA_bin_95]|nr:phosphoribosylformylglycinamidine synthase subunit PurS [Cyanobacteria bacterium MAG APA_bin_95]
MPRFHATVRVGLRSSVLDPAGEAVCVAAQRLGHGAIQSIRIGKAIEIRLDAPDAVAARQQLESLSAQLLTNPVMETWSLEFHHQEA